MEGEERQSVVLPRFLRNSLVRRPRDVAMRACLWPLGLRRRRGRS